MKSEYAMVRVRKNVWLRLRKLKFKLTGQLEEPVSLGDVIGMLIDAGTYEDRLHEKRRKEKRSK